MLIILCFILYAVNTTKNYDDEGTQRAIYLSQSFSRKR